MSVPSSSSQHEGAVQAVQAYVVAQAYDPGTLPPSLSDSLCSGALSLLQLIRILGQYLTSEDERIRSSGVELLAQVVIDLASPSSAAVVAPEVTLFDKQTVRTLSNFFADKLEDGSNVAASIARSTNSAEKVVPGSAPHSRFKAVPEGTEMLASTLQALSKLARLDGFGSGETKTVATALIDHTTPRDHPQAVRFMIFSVLDALLATNRAALKAMGKKFLKGYVQLAEGEKDPRNLMYLFAMDRVILIEWELDTESAEEFFDIVYCYFPITFRPPPDDPYGISTEDLKRALRDCLTANPLLAPHAMPLLLEKLAASGGNTKRDTLDTLEHALPVFGRAATLANERKLWEGFKVEIMAATDEETSIYAQRALSSFLRVLYQSESSSELDTEPEGIALRVVADAMSELEEPEKSLAKPACELLTSMIKACPTTAHLAIYALLNQMLTMFKDPDVVSIRAPILGHIATVLKAMRDVYVSEDALEVNGSGGALAATTSTSLFKFAAPSSSTDIKPAANPGGDTAANATADTPMAAAARSYDGDGRPLDALRDELLSALSNGIRSPSYRSSALLAFVHLTHIPTFLSAPETNYMAESVNELILSPGAEDVRGAALDGLRDIARVNPRVLEETTLPLLFSRLPDRMPPNDNEGTAKGVVRRALGALARLSIPQGTLFDHFIAKVFAKLELTCATPALTAEEREANVGYARGLLVTILTVLEEKTREKHTDLPRYAVALPPRLFSLVLTAAMRGSKGTNEEPPVATDENVIRDVGRILTVLIRQMSVEKQTELAQWMYTAFIKGDVGSASTTAGESFTPFDAASPAPQRNSLYVFSAAFVPLDKQVQLPQDEDAKQWLSRLLEYILTSTTTLQADAGYGLLATSVNKHVTDTMLAGDVMSVVDGFWKSELAARASETGETWTLSTATRRSRAIRAWLWLCKGLIVRNSKHGETLFERARQTLFESSNSNSSSGGTTYLAKEAARCIGIVAQAEDGILSKENGAVVRLLYKQKFFAYLLPRIIGAYSDARNGPKGEINLIALSSILPHLPRQTTTERLPEIFPLLLRALDLQDGQARASAATTLTLAAAVGKRDRDVAIRSGSAETAEAKKVRNALDLIQDDLASLVDRLLRIALPSKDSPPSTRIASLRCLATLARTVPYTQLKGQQVKVTRALNGPRWGVDDPRKDVRSQAVDTKAVWHAAG